MAMWFAGHTCVTGYVELVTYVFQSAPSHVARCSMSVGMPSHTPGDTPHTARVGALNCPAELSSEGVLYRLDAVDHTFVSQHTFVSGSCCRSVEVSLTHPR